MEKEKNVNNGVVVRKSNALIGGKYKSSLLENKLLAISLTRLQMSGENITAELYPSEIKRLIGQENNTNIYKKLKHTAKIMTGHQIVIEDNNGNFKAFSMINNVDYEDQVFKITFNKNMRPLVTELKGNFTAMALGTLMMFEKNCSYRIYEILKKDAYRCNPGENEGVFQREYGLNEFRCMIGLVNLDEPNVAAAVANNKSWDEIYERIAIDKQYPEWRDFKRYVLEPAQKELWELSDISFTYKPLTGGRGRKVIRLLFNISKNVISQEKKLEVQNRAKQIKEKSDEFLEMDLTDALDKSEVYKYVDNVKLTKEDIDELIEFAKYDTSKVINAVEMANKQEYISNYIGWVRSCIQNNYQEPIETISGSVELASAHRELREVANSNATRERAWERIKGKEDFSEFLSSIGLSLEAFEISYDDYGERVEVYTSWKTGRLN